ncbi:hypothetical protein MHYP_G00135760 [Metynnis hypsauchen]
MNSRLPHRAAPRRQRLRAGASWQQKRRRVELGAFRQRHGGSAAADEPGRRRRKGAEKGRREQHGAHAEGGEREPRDACACFRAGVLEEGSGGTRAPSRLSAAPRCSSPCALRAALRGPAPPCASRAAARTHVRSRRRNNATQLQLETAVFLFF